MDGDICEHICDDKAPWYEFFASMNITSCPILEVSVRIIYTTFLIDSVISKPEESVLNPLYISEYVIITYYIIDSNLILST